MPETLSVGITTVWVGWPGAQQHRRSRARRVAEVDREAGKAPARGLLGEHAALQRHPEHVPDRVGRDGRRHRREGEEGRDDQSTTHDQMFRSPAVVMIRPAARQQCTRPPSP